MLVQVANGSASARPEPGAANVDQNSAEPRLRRARLTELRPARPGPFQRLLDSVLGLDGVAQDVTGESVGSGQFPAVDRRETRLCSPDRCLGSQLNLHREFPPFF